MTSRGHPLKGPALPFSQVTEESPKEGVVPMVPDASGSLSSPAPLLRPSAPSWLCHVVPDLQSTVSTNPQSDLPDHWSAVFTDAQPVLQLAILADPQPDLPDRQSAIFANTKPDLQLPASCSALQRSASPAPNLLVLSALSGLRLRHQPPDQPCTSGRPPSGHTPE
eukprot:superscaffoldBa00011535_g25259